MNIDTLIHAQWILTVDAQDRIFEHHALAIHNGRILGIVPSAEATERYRAEQVHELGERALLPGLINAHTHASMSLLRGLADDMALMTWLNQHIWPAEQRWVSEEFVADGTRLAVAEMLRGGISCFNDMYFFPEVTGQVSAAAGMRAMVGLILIDFPSAWAGGPDEYLRRGLEVHDQFRGSKLVRTAFAPHAPYSVSDAPLARLRVLADELEIPLHMHVHETREEVQQSLAQYGVRPLQRLADLQLTADTLMAVHMTQLEADEIEHFAAAGSHVVHCPASNLKLASGFCPVAKLLENGFNVALGTDGAASNNRLDMFNEMRTAALLAKGVAGDASVVPARQALRMATINGARALGMDDEVGSLEPGKAADVCAVDLGDSACQPAYHPESQLVYTAGRDNVSDLWIAGKQVLREGQLTTLDQQQICIRAKEWRAKIAQFDH